MKIIALGDVYSKYIMDDLPELGIVIGATKEELRTLPTTILNREVEVVEKLGAGQGDEAAVRLKYSPTTQEDCRWVVCSYGHLLPPWCGDDDAPVRKFTGAEFAQMIRDNYDLTYARNALAAHYAEDGIGEVWNRHLGDAIGDGFNWTLNSWVEGLSFSRLEGCAGKKRKEGV